MSPDVSVVVVTHDSAADLPLSLPSAVAQKGISVEILVVDNASSDRSRDVALLYAPNVRVLPLPENVGFAGAMNAGIEATSGRYVLAPTTRLDSTGIVFMSSGRHLDRGSGEEAEGRYLEEEEVAGTTAAAGFYRREALDSAKISTGYFDSDFFLYREDADLALRLSKLGWKCLYVPGAVAWHRRRNLPERRYRMSAAANLHSVKNRFLLRINNQSASELVRTLGPTLARDLVVVCACLTVERSSLPAFSWLWKNRRRLWAKRREIQTRVNARRSR